MRISAPFGTLDELLGDQGPRPPVRLEPLWWALRAVWLETLGFRFGYPVELVPEAGPRSSVHYYIYSDQLFFDLMEIDRDGIPYHRSRTLGRFYNPAYVAWYGLMALERSQRGGKNSSSAFAVQINWLVRNAVRREDGSVVWPFPVDVQEGKAELKAPWVSAMIQGLALSALVRAHRLKLGPADLLELCHSALCVYGRDVSDGGVRTVHDGLVLFEEYPAYPLPRVLDGFLFSLLGLYDYWIESDETLARNLFEKGVAGLAHTLEYWNYKDRWTWYGSHGYLCPPYYHNLNRLLLIALSNVTGQRILAHYAEAWNPARLTVAERIKLFATYFVLKQRARLRKWRD
jgi:hypothetical protein